MSAYDITEFLHTAYRPFAYCVLSKSPLNSTYQKRGVTLIYGNASRKMSRIYLALMLSGKEKLYSSSIRLKHNIFHKASFTLSLFSTPASLRLGHWAHWDHTVATQASTALNLETPCWTGIHREVAPVVSILIKHPGLTGTHRAAKQRRLIPGHHRISSGMNRIATVRSPSETVPNRPELWPRWRYGESRHGDGVSQRRAGEAPTLAGRTTVWHGSSRWMLVKLR